MFMPLGRSMYSRDDPDPGAELAQIRELAELGVTQLAVGFPVDTRREYLRSLEHYSREIVARIA
jgi:hypothetical protein